MPLPYCSSIGFVIQKGHILLFVVMYSPVAFHACVVVSQVSKSHSEARKVGTGHPSHPKRWAFHFSFLHRFPVTYPI